MPVAWPRAWPRLHADPGAVFEVAHGLPAAGHTDASDAFKDRSPQGPRPDAGVNGLAIKDVAPS